jgi:hypothetical protein
MRLRRRAPIGGPWHRSARGDHSRYGPPPSRSLPHGGPPNRRRPRRRPAARRSCQPRPQSGLYGPAWMGTRPALKVRQVRGAADSRCRMRTSPRIPPSLTTTLRSASFNTTTSRRPKCTRCSLWVRPSSGSRGRSTTTRSKHDLTDEQDRTKPVALSPPGEGLRPDSLTHARVPAPARPLRCRAAGAMEARRVHADVSHASTPRRSAGGRVEA